MAASASALLAVLSSFVAADEFVPECIARQCSSEAMALGNDSYARSLATCIGTDFGPCAKDAWDCLGDSKCQQALQCAPKVLATCEDSIWKMVTDPDEREKITCMWRCEKDGKIDPICVAAKCAVSAVKCLTDVTCLKAATCLPKAMISCSGEAFDCIFGTDKVCQKNLECLGHGVTVCSAPALNIVTDTRIGDLVSCAGSRCPHPKPPHHDEGGAEDEGESGSEEATFVDDAEPKNVAEQLACLTAKCPLKAIKILRDQDTNDLLKCVTQDDMPGLCPSMWQCLGDESCQQAIRCWSQPFGTCSSDMWHALTDADQRSRIESAITCLQGCEQTYRDDFVDATFCVMDMCSQAIIDCNSDVVCREAVKCVPKALGQCAIPLLESYTQQELFRNSTKCIGRGLELCGAAAVEMLRDQNIVEAVGCASQCTISPKPALI